MYSYKDIIELQRKKDISDINYYNYEYCHNESELITKMKDQNKMDVPMSVQSHVHEFESSVKLAEENDDRHNHRFAGVTSEVIPLPNMRHKHVIFTKTDFFDHLHDVAAETEPNIDVGHGKHVHFVTGTTTIDDGHFHQFAFTTLIESPLLPPA